MDDKILKAIEYAKKNSKKRTSIFQKYDDIIIAMKENNATYEIVLSYLFMIDKEIKTRYENKMKIAISRLSAYCKRIQIKEVPSASKIEPKKTGDDKEAKNKSLASVDIEEEKRETFDERMQKSSDAMVALMNKFTVKNA